jgi:NAD+ kinase
MRVAIFSQDQERTVKSVKLSLESHGIESFLLGSKQLSKDVDYVIVTE